MGVRKLINYMIVWLHCMYPELTTLRSLHSSGDIRNNRSVISCVLPLVALFD